jgi:hypothetical protein
MDRRTALKFIGSLPFGALLIPKRVEAEAPVVFPARKASTLPEGRVLFDLSAMEMGEQLVQNLRTVQARLDEDKSMKPLTIEEHEVQESIARRLPLSLRSEQYRLNPPAGHFTSYDMRPKEPDPMRSPEAWDRDLLRQVHFGVMTAPVATTKHPITGETISLTAVSRKIRAKLNWEVLEDLRAFHGIDPVYEAVLNAASETSLEIGMECRRDCSYGMMPSIFAIYLPPILSPALLDPGDFSICRGYRIRYAKTI